MSAAKKKKNKKNVKKSSSNKKNINKNNQVNNTTNELSKDDNTKKDDIQKKSEDKLVQKKIDKTEEENMQKENKAKSNQEKIEKKNEKVVKEDEKDKKDEKKSLKEKTIEKKEESTDKDDNSEKETNEKLKDTSLIKSEKEEIIVKKDIPEILKKIKNKFIKKNNEKDNENKIEKKDDKPEYVQQMLKNKKRKMYIFICIVILIILITMFSTVFAILNLNNTKIISGVSAKNIDISNLNVEEAKNKIEEKIKIELMPDINLKYNEYEISLNAEQIEFEYKIDEVIDKAYSIARTSNIISNNYKLLFSSLLGNKLKIDYKYNDDLLEQFINGINSEIPGVVVEPSYYIEDGKLIISKGQDGIQVQKEKLKETILTTISNRNYQEIVDDSFKDQIDIPVENVKASEIDIEKIYSEIHKEPQDAYFETNPYKIYPDVDGVDLAISVDEAKNIIKSEDKDEYTFDLNITKASKTINDLGTEAFPYLISSFSTKYDASNVNRSTNLKIAAQKINGTVLMPGEEFSYNKVVGKRTVEEGYKDAKIYADGGVVDGLAGGICQISSTLYNAVLLANLEVTERRNHTYTTSYVAAGRDATVVWGTKDFKFKNSRSYPIKIEATVSNGIAEFKIHGIEEEKEYEIKILPVTTASIPYSTSYIQDASLIPGQQIVSQKGHPGYKVTTYKEVRYNGEVISKEAISNDTYSPMQTIIRTGPQIQPVAEPAM